MTTFNSNFHKNKWSELEDFYKSELENNMQITGHTYRTIIGLAIIFVVGGLQALNGNASVGSWIEIILPVLLFVEHNFFGNIGTTNQ